LTALSNVEERYNRDMSRLARLAAVIAFALANLSQPLALDACSVSCEAARASRAAAVAAPCHHTTSCATQISAPGSPGSTAIDYTLAPPIVVVEIRPEATWVALARAHSSFTSSGPPITTQLRV
jgi:hypothetical protein